MPPLKCLMWTTKMKFSLKYKKTLHIWSPVIFVISVASSSSFVFLFFLLSIALQWTMYALVEELGQKENDLNAASDGEPRKKAHCSSNETQLRKFKWDSDIGKIYWHEKLD